MPMRSFKWDAPALVAVLSVLGPGLVALNQMGRYAYYDIPFELLEIDTYKLLTSGFSLLFAVASTLYLATSVVSSDVRPTNMIERVVVYVVLATLLSLPIWGEQLELGGDVSWPIVGLIALMAWALGVTERALVQRRSREPLSERVGRWALAAFASALAVAICTTVLGYQSERSRTNYTFIAGTPRAIVGKSGDSLITKVYEPSAKRFRPGVTVLVSVDKTLTLQVKQIDRTQ